MITTNIMPKMRANTRREVTTRKDSKKVATRRREVQRRVISMKITRVTRTNMDMNLITLITRNMARRVARREDLSMVKTIKLKIKIENFHIFCSQVLNQVTVMEAVTVAKVMVVIKLNDKTNFNFPLKSIRGKK